MKKTNRSICLLVRCTLVFCFGCFAGIPAFAQLTDAGTVPLFPKSRPKLCIGASTIFEDGYERFNTFGPTISYTHPIVGRLGAIGNTGYYFGKIGDGKYSKILLHGGICFVPRDDKFSISPHILAGLMHDQIKFKMDNGSSTSKGTEFSWMAGTNVSIPLNKKTTIVAKVDYNPTVSDMETKNNFSAGVGVNINVGRTVVRSNPPTHQSSYATTTKSICKASKDVKELKISFAMIDEIIKSAEKIANSIPRVEAKIFMRPEVNIRRGEECCSPDKTPVAWTEFRGGVEGGGEININLWGIPDIKYSVTLWPVMLAVDFQCKLFAGPTAKFSLEPVGRFYGELFGEKRPDCKACFYWNVKGEGFIRIGVKAGGKLNLYHWSPFNDGDGFDLKEPDETLEVSAEASASIGHTLSATYVADPGCTSPQQGFHGAYKFGKAKANLKFNVKLGPLSFDPSWEINIFDGFQFPF